MGHDASQSWWGRPLNARDGAFPFLVYEGAGLAAHFRVRFQAPRAEAAEVRCCALDEALLFVNGALVARLGENSAAGQCFCRRVRLPLRRGRNEVRLLAWRLGEHAAYSRTSAFCGVAMQAVLPRHAAWLDTGRAPWEMHEAMGLSVRLEHIAATAGYPVVMDGRTLAAPTRGWQPAVYGCPAAAALRIYESPLPPQQEAPWLGAHAVYADDGDDGTMLAAESCRLEWVALAERLLQGQAVEVPPRTRFRALADLGRYGCVLASFHGAGRGASVSLRFTEALFTVSQTERFQPLKGRRDEWEGRWFFGKGDCFQTGTRPAFFTNLDWQAGRYAMLEIRTGSAPLRLEGFALASSGYPLSEEGGFQLDAGDDGRWRETLVRTIRMCAHDTYMDCPFYERLMYVGDTRLQVLATYLLTRDRRLPRKALLTLAESRLENGLLLSRYPDRHSQVIPPFALWWVAMLEDYARWTDDAPLVRRLLPMAEGVAEAFRACEGADGLVTCPQGWNFYDWVEDAAWERGAPPGHGGEKPGALLNWHYVGTLMALARLEAAFGDATRSRARTRQAARLAAALRRRFYVAERGLYSDDLEHLHYSQHTQLLAMLSGLLSEEAAGGLYRRMQSAGKGLAQCTIYFSHYLFEAMQKFGDAASFLKALDYWRRLPAEGFTTTPERPEPSRSDCHAWGAHPYFRVMTFLGGVSPRGYGAREYEVRPCAALPEGFQATVPLPAGDFRVACADGALTVEIPASGTFWLGGQRLAAGAHRMAMDKREAGQ